MSQLHPQKFGRSWVFPAFLLIFSGPVSAFDWADLWFSPDQQGQRLLEQKNYAASAQKFTQPESKGAALFLAGEFEKAAAVLGRSSSAEANYNRGNAQVMLGNYAAAIDAYENALARHPGWLEAEQNLQIAKLRMAAKAGPDEDYGGTGGQLEADDYVFDMEKGKNKASGEETTEGGQAENSDAELRALWLRKVETRPADFLAARFSYQLYLQEKNNPKNATDTTGQDHE